MTSALLLALALSAGKPAPAVSKKGSYYRLESLIGLKLGLVDKKVCKAGFVKVKGLSAAAHELELWRCDAFPSLIDALDKSPASGGWAQAGSKLVLALEDGRIATAEASKGVDSAPDAEELYQQVGSALKDLDCANVDDQGTSLAVMNCAKGGPSFEVVNHLMRESRHTLETPQHTLILQAGRDWPTVQGITRALK